MNLVTVCITTYNRKALLPLTLKSILSQTYKNLEIIIVDDCSTDGTQDFVENQLLKLDKRIRYIKHAKNKGLAAARNTAIKNSKGKYFTFCDDDDIWREEFIEVFIEKSKYYNDTYSFCASIISNKKAVKGILAPFKELLIRGYTPPVASQFYFTDNLKKVGGYDEKIKSGVDHDLWLTLGHNEYKLIWINQELSKENRIQSDGRMTFNFNKRVNGIRCAINIWENRIENSFGNNFVKCLEKNYEYNTYKKFILFSLKENKFSDVFNYWKKLPKILFLLDLKRYIISKFNNSSLLLHPNFEGCRNNILKGEYNIEILRE